MSLKAVIGQESEVLAAAVAAKAEGPGGLRQRWDSAMLAAAIPFRSDGSQMEPLWVSQVV